MAETETLDKGGSGNVAASQTSGEGCVCKHATGTCRNTWKWHANDLKADTTSMTADCVNVHTTLNVFGKSCAQPALTPCIETVEARCGQANCPNNITAVAPVVVVVVVVVARADAASMLKWNLEKHR